MSLTVQLLIPTGSPIDSAVLALKELKKSLKPGALLAVKENVMHNRDRKPVIRKQDHSILRTRNHFAKLFKLAGFRIVAEEPQFGFPRFLAPVQIFMLKPLDEKSN